MAKCKNCCTRFKAKELQDREVQAVTKNIKDTFGISESGELWRLDYLGRHYKVKPATLYTLTGGRRVTHTQVVRVLNGGPLYKTKKMRA